MNLVEYHIVLLADQQFDTPHAKCEGDSEHAPVDLVILIQYCVCVSVSCV